MLAFANRWRPGLILFLDVALLAGCRRPAATIAIIPRTTATALWEPLQGGAELEASRFGYKLYWNGPAREDDFEAQIALLNQEIDRRVQGIIVAPSQSHALVTPVRRALAHGIPLIVVSSSLNLPPGGGLAYILNDEDKAAELCGQRVLALTAGHGSVVLMGIDPNLAGMTARVEAIERYFAVHAPDIRIEKRFGNQNALQEQQVAREVINNEPDLGVLVGLVPGATRGGLAALHDAPALHSLKVIGFDMDDAPPFDEPALDSVVLQDTHMMGSLAVREVADLIQGHQVALFTRVAPVLLTRENKDSPLLAPLLRRDGPFSWERP